MSAEETMDTEVAVVVSGVVVEVPMTAALLDTSMNAVMPADAGATSNRHLNPSMLLLLDRTLSDSA